MSRPASSVSRSPPAQSGCVGSRPQLSMVSLPRSGTGRRRLRRRQRRGRIAEGLHPPPERREHPQAPAFLVADAGGADQEIAGKALRSDADLLQRRRDLVGHGLCGACAISFQNTVVGAGLARQVGDDLCRRPAAQHQRRRRSTRGSFCKARSDCASHQRAAPPSGRAFGARAASRRKRRDRSPARRCSMRRAGRDDRRGADRRETRRCRGGGFAGHQASTRKPHVGSARKRHLQLCRGLIRTMT